MAQNTDDHPIPIIDLFAGPGGLGEGFSRLHKDGKRRFKIRLSIEKDFHAHLTLTLRAFFREFPLGEVPEDYYQYLRGELTRDDLFKRFPEQAEAALDEARCLTLGKDEGISKLISAKLNGTKEWVLIGGPPCQAYSLVGRSRMLGAGAKKDAENDDDFAQRRREKAVKFEGDHRHLLYREYLKVIAEHRPSVFVMENVKGILSAKLDGELIFPKIIADLSNPSKAVSGFAGVNQYRIYSLVKESDGEDLNPGDYLIRAEDYGVPQARHRVILIGVRLDLDRGSIPILEPKKGATVQQTIGGLPPLTPGLSKERHLGVYEALAAVKEPAVWKTLHKQLGEELAGIMEKQLEKARRREMRGGAFVSAPEREADHWYTDSKLLGFCNHETRSHIKEDLWRYFFCACFAKSSPERSPQLADFPVDLLPRHKNVSEAIEGQKFGDRFRVQLASKPSTTITSHISKDGHYFIHYDPKQYRSLTVREAARLQTFPDNYFFEGPRTQQFHQVGNAVPPRLAAMIAAIASRILTA